MKQMSVVFHWQHIPHHALHLIMFNSVKYFTSCGFGPALLLVTMSFNSCVMLADRIDDVIKVLKRDVPVAKTYIYNTFWEILNIKAGDCFNQYQDTEALDWL